MVDKRLTNDKWTVEAIAEQSIDLEGPLDQTIGALWQTLNDLTEKGWTNLQIECDWSEGNQDNYFIHGTRQMTEAEIARKKRTMEKKREEARKAKEEKEAQERAEFERLQKKYGNSNS